MMKIEKPHKPEFLKNNKKKQEILLTKYKEIANENINLLGRLQRIAQNPSETKIMQDADNSILCSSNHRIQTHEDRK